MSRLYGRLRKLEEAERQNAGLKDDDVRAWFINDLTRLAGRINEDDPASEDWCRRVSRYDIIGAAIQQLVTGRRSDALWTKVQELAKAEDYLGDLFASLYAQRLRKDG